MNDSKAKGWLYTAIGALIMIALFLGPCNEPLYNVVPVGYCHDEPYSEPCK